MKDKRFYANTLSVAKKINLINKLGGCCSKCGETRPWALEFHHEGDKDFVISQNKELRISELEQEIEKCICLCANCHREVHRSGKVTKYSKAKIKMLEYKKTNCCSKCGYSKLNSALEFHHINPNTKELELSKCRIVAEEITTTTKQELDKCIVLCANCHREEHYNVNFFEENKEYILEKSKNIKEIQPALDKEEVRKLYESGIKPIEIARKYKASKGTISGILKSFGIRCVKIMPIEEIINLRKLGYTQKQIAAQLNISKSSVGKYLRNEK